VSRDRCQWDGFCDEPAVATYMISVQAFNAEDAAEVAAMDAVRVALTGSIGSRLCSEHAEALDRLEDGVRIIAPGATRSGRGYLMFLTYDEEAP